tara:strand:+ start:1280 stop:1567 length:288 start_codon:yes stop_codon:yes gene_type:complete
LKVQQFLRKRDGVIETSEEISLHLQMFAYVVAKHYRISLMEVYNMSEEVFKQSLVWALAVEEEQQKEQEKQDMVNRTGSSEIITFDYSFLDREDL